jgi:hypothetical protein
MAKEWAIIREIEANMWAQITVMQICPNTSKLFSWNTCKMLNQFTIKKGISVGKAHQ